MQRPERIVRQALGHEPTLFRGVGPQPGDLGWVVGQQLPHRVAAQHRVQLAAGGNEQVVQLQVLRVRLRFEDQLRRGLLRGPHPQHDQRLALVLAHRENEPLHQALPGIADERIELLQGVGAQHPKFRVVLVALDQPQRHDQPLAQLDGFPVELGMRQFQIEDVVDFVERLVGDEGPLPRRAHEQDLPLPRRDGIDQRVREADLDPDARSLLDVSPHAGGPAGLVAVQRSQQRVVRRADDLEQHRPAAGALHPAEALAIITESRSISPTTSGNCAVSASSKMIGVLPATSGGPASRASGSTCSQLTMTSPGPVRFAGGEHAEFGERSREAARHASGRLDPGAALRVGAHRRGFEADRRRHLAAGQREEQRLVIGELEDHWNAITRDSSG